MTALMVGEIARAMDVAEFEDLIDRMGEDLSCWPEGVRLAAEQLLASSSEARALQEKAQALRRLLAVPPVRAPAGLADRIVAAASERASEPVLPQAEGEMDEKSVTGPA